MNTLKTRLMKIATFLIFTGMLASCTAKTAAHQELLPPTPAPVAQPSAAPSPSPVPSATIQIIPSATPSSTVTPTSVPPSPSPSPTNLACWANGGQIELQQLATELLREPLDFRVYLPPCYHEQPERYYPSLYLIHGQGFTDDQWDRLGADEIANALILAGEASPFLIIMPRDRLWTQPVRDPFGKAVIEVLIPWVEQHYRLQDDREARAIGGLSRGAGWAIHLGLGHWEMFSIIGAHSLPVFLDDTPSIRPWLDSIPSESMPRFYLDMGVNDQAGIRQSATWFEALLNERGYPHEWRLFPGFHNEEYWQAHVEQYMRWYVRDW